MVERIRAAVQQADGLLIATCEYNGASASVFVFVLIDRILVMHGMFTSSQVFRRLRSKTLSIGARARATCGRTNRPP